MDHQFRTAAFGGFNRQDVLDYLASSALANQQQLQAVQEQLDQSRKELEESAAQKDEIQALQAQAEELQSQLAQAKVREQELTKALEAAQQRVQQLDLRVTQLEPDAMAYAAVKERSAGVELEAHRRAQTIQEKAERDAQKARRQVEQWLKRMGREYDALCTQVETTVSHAASELEKAGAGLERLNELMSGQGTALEGVRRAYDETNLGRPEAPMPIDET